MKTKSAYIGLCYICFLIGGLGITMVGALLPDIMAEYRLDYKTAGTILSLQSLGIMLAAFFSGAFADRLGKKTTLALGVCLFGAGLSSFIFASHTLGLQICCAVAGIGYGMINNMGNSLVNDISEGNNIAINLLHVSYAVGCFLVPLLVQFSIMLNSTWRFPVKVSAILAGFIFLAIVISPLHNMNEDKKAASRSSYGFLKDVHYYVLLLALLLCTGFHNGIIGWLVTYLIDSGIIDAIGAQRLFSFMLLSMIIGRLMISVLCKYIKPDTLLLLCCTIPVLVLSCMAITGNQNYVVALLILCGISYAGQYPLIVSNAKKILLNNANASGLLFALSGLGGTLTTYLCGYSAERFGARAILFTIILVGILLWGTSLLNRRMMRRKCIIRFEKCESICH